MKQYTYKEMPFKTLSGISDKTNAIHHDKLYAGYVKKKDEIQEKLKTVELGSANQTYSELRALKDAETFAVNGTYLHDIYFDGLGDSSHEPAGAILTEIKKRWGSFEKFKAFFKACGLAARGWAVLSWDTFEQGLHIYTRDAHNQGGVWGALPVITMDVYEHAYFMDFGSDRGAYIDAWFENLNWAKIEKRFQNYKNVATQ